MKHVFTTFVSLFAVAAMASAAEKVELYDEFSAEFSAPKAWAGEWKNVTMNGGDLTAYEYIWISYTDCVGSIRMGLKYSEFVEVGGWGAAYVEDTKDFVAGNGVLGIKIDNTTKMVKGFKDKEEATGEFVGDVYGKHVNQVYIQTKADESSIKIVSVMVGTKAEYDAAVEAAKEPEVKPEAPSTPAESRELKCDAFSNEAYVGEGAYSVGDWKNIDAEDADLTEYEYVWIKYSECKGGFKFGLKYSEYVKTESWGAVHKESVVENIPEGAGVVGIQIDNTTKMVVGFKNAEDEEGQFIGDVYGQHCQQVFVQNTADNSTLKVEGVFVGNKAAYDAAVASKGNAISNIKIIKDGVARTLTGAVAPEGYKGIVIIDGVKRLQK